MTFNSFLVTDSASGEPLGMFYLDMFPRDGKFNHFAQFDIISGKLLPNGKYQRPTVALLCNFPPPSADKPSLMTHTDVETLFHEFGHALHSIVTRAKYGRFAGAHVPGDFVEAPSQMLQNWVWDKKVLDTFAADYRDPSKKIPAELIQKMNDAKLANAGKRSIDVRLPGPRLISRCTINIRKARPTIASEFRIPFSKRFFCRSIRARRWLLSSVT